VKTPFTVTIQAWDPINQAFTNFAGTVLLTSTNGVPVNPAFSGSFVQGAWTGSLTIGQTFTNLVLRADDGAGHAGLANAISILSPPSIGMAMSGNNCSFTGRWSRPVLCWKIQAAWCRHNGSSFHTAVANRRREYGVHPDDRHQPILPAAVHTAVIKPAGVISELLRLCPKKAGKHAGGWFSLNKSTFNI